MVQGDKVPESEKCRSDAYIVRRRLDGFPAEAGSGARVFADRRLLLCCYFVVFQISNAAASPGASVVEVE
jgi:hypothetical protein